MSDHISDFIIQIKNAGAAGNETITVPHSKLNAHIAALLKDEGYVASVTKRQHKGKKFLEVGILYEGDDVPRVHGVKRVSKPSRRIYTGAADIRPVRRGFGTQVLSTPAGVLTGTEAQKKGVGGEVLFEIW